MNEIKFVLEQIWLGRQDAGLETFAQFQLWFVLALAVVRVATFLWARAHRAILLATSKVIVHPSVECIADMQPGIIQAIA